MSHSLNCLLSARVHSSHQDDCTSFPFLERVRLHFFVFVSMFVRMLWIVPVHHWDCVVVWSCVFVFVPSSPASLFWSLGKLIYSLTLHILSIARCSLPLIFSKRRKSDLLSFLEIVSLVHFLFGNGAHVCNDIFCSFMLLYEIFIEFQL